MKNKRIPEITISRLSLYNRLLQDLQEKGVDSVTSTELGKKMGLKASQVRRDLTYFGRFGSPRVGYEVKQLLETLKGILGLHKKWPVALVGCGNLGKAFLSYPGFKQHGFEISIVFDNDPAKIGKVWKGKKIFDPAKMAKIIKEKGIKIAIIAVPYFAAQEVCDKLVRSDVKAILNFVPCKLFVPKEEGVKIRNIDIAIELEGLSAYLVR